jgi:hypothetical protein
MAMVSMAGHMTFMAIVPAVMRSKRRDLGSRELSHQTAAHGEDAGDTGVDGKGLGEITLPAVPVAAPLMRETAGFTAKNGVSLAIAHFQITEGRLSHVDEEGDKGRQDADERGGDPTL